MSQLYQGAGEDETRACEKKGWILSRNCNSIGDLQLHWEKSGHLFFYSFFLIETFTLAGRTMNPLFCATRFPLFHCHFHSNRCKALRSLYLSLGEVASKVSSCSSILSRQFKKGLKASLLMLRKPLGSMQFQPSHGKSLVLMHKSLRPSSLRAL